MVTMTEPLPDGHPDRWLPDGFQDPGSVELAGTSEVAQALGVGRTRVSMWAQRRESSGFPAPLAVLAAGPVYDLAEVRAWFADKYQGEQP